MMATASSPRPRRHHRSSTGSSFDAGSASTSAAFAPLAVPRRAPTPEVRTPPRIRRAAFQVGGSSEEDEDDCPLSSPLPHPVLRYPFPPLTIPEREATPVARCSSSPTLTNPPKPTTVPSSASSTNSFNSGASTPIYLKNGRPLKPSLKSRVSLSLSTPDMASMRAHAKSAPSTPRVHFPTRERLESVVLFDKRARPLEVASGDSPLISPNFYDDEDTGIPSLRIRPQSSFPFPNMSPRGSSTHLQGFSAALMAKTKLKIALPRSAPLQPVPHPDAHVHLAAMRLLGTRMSGSVLVKNVSFNKRVSIRYTFDNWETTSEVSAAWSSPNALADLPQGDLKPFGEEETELDIARGILVHVPQGWDRFTFNLKLDDVAPYLSARSLLVAVKFEASGVGEWWDSCGGRNYRFEFDHVPRKEKEPKKEEPTTPKPVGRPRSNTSPAPLNSDATVADPASASLLSAKLNEVASQERPALKLQLPSDETVKAEDSTPTPRAVHKPLTPPDSNSSSPREAPAELPQQPKPETQPPALPSPEDSPSSGRRQSSPLPSPSAIAAPAHSTTNVKDQSYADFIAKYCFAGAAPAPTSHTTSPPSYGTTSPPTYGGFASSGPSFGNYSSHSTRQSDFGWGSSGAPWSSDDDQGFLLIPPSLPLSPL
ncbi:hypothetical protein OPQ81_003022 [Rhizoctonia solani]|nr:hypothetical protein OPQ81_003022 [Rhizoctonia solani]